MISRLKESTLENFMLHSPIGYVVKTKQDGRAAYLAVVGKDIFITNSIYGAEFFLEDSDAEDLKDDFIRQQTENLSFKDEEAELLFKDTLSDKLIIQPVFSSDASDVAVENVPSTFLYINLGGSYKNDV